MIDEQTTGHETQARTLAEYAADLASSGVQVLPGAPGTFWTRHESGAMMRRPTFHVGPPASGELQGVLWHGRAAVTSYLVEPDEDHPANGWLYLCTDQTYALEKLASNGRR